MSVQSSPRACKRQEILDGPFLCVLFVFCLFQGRPVFSFLVRWPLRGVPPFDRQAPFFPPSPVTQTLTAGSPQLRLYALFCLFFFFAFFTAVINDLRAVSTSGSNFRQVANPFQGFFFPLFFLTGDHHVDGFQVHQIPACSIGPESVPTPLFFS